MSYTTAFEGLRNNVETMLQKSKTNQFLLTATELHLSGDSWPRESPLFAAHTQPARTTQEATSLFWTSSSPKRKFSNPYTRTQCHNTWIMFLGSVLAWSLSFLVYPVFLPHYKSEVQKPLPESNHKSLMLWRGCVAPKEKTEAKYRFGALFKSHQAFPYFFWWKLNQVTS